MTSTRDILLRIRDDRGILTPAVVLEEARAEDHPLHSRFDWDDSTAAEKYRLHQAGELIRSVRIEYLQGEKKVEAPAFVSIARKAVPAREYVPIESVANSEEIRAMALRDAERQWRALFERFKHIEGFLAVVREDVAA